MPSYSFRDGLGVTQEELITRFAAPFAVKFKWFLDKGYSPHKYQAVFHGLTPNDGDPLCRFRHLVAGRRGGKTLSAAWEVLFYAMHPREFHWDAHHTESDRPLHIWVLAKDHKVGGASLKAFRDILKDAGLTHGKDYRENRGDLFFEFPDGTLIEWKTAVDPQSLRGAGLDMLWIDEAAFITTQEAFDVVTPALDDKLGIVICTTTPDGKNWYYQLFWGDQALADENIGRVEYRTLDNPYFPRSAWEHRKRTYHPLLFKQEYEAAFDSMAGKELPGDWLTHHFYEHKDLPKNDQGKVTLKLYMGFDPAISLADTADHTVAALIGVNDENGEVFLLEMEKRRIPFAEQLELIREWHLKYRPTLIGVEGVAYQAALVQQALRLPNLPPIMPVLSKGKKSDRILSMSPLFKIGKVRVRADHRDFIDEWLGYDSTLKNPHDDCLDAMEIALRTAGALMPMQELDNRALTAWDKPSSMEQLIALDLPGSYSPKKSWDEHLGSDW